MLISYNWLSEYLSAPIALDTLTQMLTAIGLEVEGCEERQAIKGGLRGVLVGKVVTCTPHPDADRLSVTSVDIGASELLQIVCGAPNVAAGQKVAVATVGATLYPRSGDELTMKRSKIRGIESQGMLCAEDELGLGASHDGILVLNENAIIGQAAAEYFDLKSDFIIEIGLTPNRSDANSHLGVAHDVAAACTAQGRPMQVRLPKVAPLDATAPALPISVTIETEALCRRFAGITLDGVMVAESPKWLQERLLALDIRPINNVVDITNYVLYEYGQPLHAYDYDTISNTHIYVGTLATDTPFTTLDGTEIKLSEADLMVCDGLHAPMCMAGVYGGSRSGVSPSTKRVFLEAAYFDAMTLRRTSTRHQLRTAAARAFEKGIDPNGCANALQRAADLMVQIAGARVASPLLDIYPNRIEPVQVLLRFAQINRLIGNVLAVETVKGILNALSMPIVEETKDYVRISIPTNKPDVYRECDVIEEILRIYGLDNVVIDDTLKSTLTVAAHPDAYALRETVAQHLAAQGLVEIMALSLTQSHYCALLGEEAERLVYIHNTANKGLNVMRSTLLFGALEAAVRNQHRQNSDFAAFEFGKVYGRKESGAITEQHRLGITLMGQRFAENWLNPKPAEVSYYLLKAHIEGVLRRVGALDGLQMTALENDRRFVYGLRLHRGEQTIAELGRVHAALGKALEAKQTVFFGEIHWENVLKMAQKHHIRFVPLPKFPTVRRDLALVIGREIPYKRIEAIAQKEAKKLLQAVNLFDTYEDVARLGADKKSYSVSFLFADTEKTLGEAEIEATMQRLTLAYEKQLGAVIRK